jgi:hypothetical protein
MRYITVRAGHKIVISSLATVVRYSLGTIMFRKVRVTNWFCTFHDEVTRCSPAETVTNDKNVTVTFF